MRIDRIDATTFGNSQTVTKAVKKLKNHVYTDLKPIKNYVQYMREYGLLGGVKKETGITLK